MVAKTQGFTLQACEAHHSEAHSTGRFQLSLKMQQTTGASGITEGKS
jgi:hypothetical protein